MSAAVFLFSFSFSLSFFFFKGSILEAASLSISPATSPTAKRHTRVPQLAAAIQARYTSLRVGEIGTETPRRGAPSARRERRCRFHRFSVSLTLPLFFPPPPTPQTKKKKYNAQVRARRAPRPLARLRPPAARPPRGPESQREPRAPRGGAAALVFFFFFSVVVVIFFFSFTSSDAARPPLLARGLLGAPALRPRALPPPHALLQGSEAQEGL